MVVAGVDNQHGGITFKAMDIRIYVTPVFARMDYGAIPNVLSKAFTDNLSVAPNETHKIITVATGV